MNWFINLSIATLLSLNSGISNAEPKTIRIGTGGSAGTYYPIGTLLSQSITQFEISHNPSANDPKSVIAIAQRSNGSVANVNDIESGLLEAALSQADVVHWAYHATGPFIDDVPKKSLRTVASLYPESIHLVARTNSGINNVTDLVGRSVSIDEIGSGTLFDVQLVLSAFDIKLDDINPVYLKLDDSVDRLRNNQLDAFILVAGYPVQEIVDLVEAGHAIVIPITGIDIPEFIQQHPFFSVDSIPKGIYNNNEQVSTLAVSAQFIVSATLDDELVFDITKALWSKQSEDRFKLGHPKGSDISIENAITGVSIPLHPGAKRYYESQSIDTSKAPSGHSN